MGNANAGKKGDQVENGKKKFAHKQLLNLMRFTDAFKKKKENDDR